VAKEEKQIQNTIEKYLTLKKHFYWKNNTGAFKRDNHFYRFGAVGSPDICVVKDGFFIGLEVKTKTGKQSEGQKDFEKRLKEAGGEYYVIKSLEDVKNIGL